MTNEKITELLKNIADIIGYLLVPSVLKKKRSRERTEKIINILNLALNQLKRIK